MFTGMSVSDSLMKTVGPMGRVFERAAQRAQRRQHSIDAMRNADPSKITRLGRGRQFQSPNQRYQQGIEDGMTGAMTGNERDPIYMGGYGKGRRIRFQQLAFQEGAKVKTRRSAPPSPEQVAAELAARSAADEQRKAERRASGLFDALK